MSGCSQIFIYSFIWGANLPDKMFFKLSPKFMNLFTSVSFVYLCKTGREGILEWPYTYVENFEGQKRLVFLYCILCLFRLYTVCDKSFQMNNPFLILNTIWGLVVGICFKSLVIFYSLLHLLTLLSSIVHFCQIYVFLCRIHGHPKYRKLKYGKYL